ncbi:hypothetical protein AB4Z46_29370 [Variovorax sp. M-6]|uniref:hypothetical protein n=1 Tax=Variovorax sp. M-6 TaxID=3233041 RepID=UPI003F94C624
MNAIHRARRFIERNPNEQSAAVLAQLVLALESERSFELASLYELDFDMFELAVEILKEWRLDRYYAGKAQAVRSFASDDAPRRDRGTARGTSELIAAAWPGSRT